MKKKNIKIILLIFVVIMLLSSFGNVYGTTTGGTTGTDAGKSGINFDDFKNAVQVDGNNKITNIGGLVFRTVYIVGMFIAIGYATMLGMKYMSSSTDERAGVKKQLVPFVVGVILFFGTTKLVEILIDVAGWIE